MYRRRLLTALLVVAFLASMTTPVLADDSDITEYSALYHGNFANDDTHRFSYRLYYLGADGTWNGATQWSTATGERDVNHWDYTNGYPGVDPYPGANARDILYTSGHGWPNMLRLYSPLAWGDETRELDQLKRPDNLGPDDRVVSDGETVNWQLGTDWVGANRTVSRWNDDLEWAFLASCSQLSSTGDSRLMYARTLLGDPQRAHAVWGYDATAPGDGVDVSIVDDFFDYVGASYSIRYAWLKANDNYSQTNAAGVVHASTEFEGMPPIKLADVDSAVGSTPNIHYWYIPAWTYSSQPVASNGTGLIDSARRFVDRIMGVGEAFAEAPSVYAGATTTYTLKTELPELQELPILAAGSSAPALGERERGRLLGGTPQRETVTPDQQYEAYRGPAGLLKTWPSGAQSVLFSNESTAPVGVTRSQAIERATEFVRGNGGMPQDAYLREVRAFANCAMDAATGENGSETVTEYIVEFGRSYDEIEIDGTNGDSISVVVNARGVGEYRRHWRNVQGARNGSGPKAQVTAAEALQVLAQDGDQYLGTAAQADITDIDLVYYSMGPEHSQSAMYPAWRIQLDEADDFYVNAITGRPMNE